MTRNKSRFDFLDEVTAEPATPTEPQAQVRSDLNTSPEQAATPYLFRQFSRTDPQAPLGNRVRLEAKHHLEDYTRDLKRAGYPATEARVLEALMLLLAEDATLRSTLTTYLTGKAD